MESPLRHPSIPSRTRSDWPRRALAALAGAGLLLGAQASHAQNWVPFFEEGKKLQEAGKWVEACPKFAEAHRLKPDATGITLNLADCYKHVGKSASAYSLFREGGFLAKKGNDAPRAEYAEKEAAALEPTLSKLRIEAEDTPGLVIHIDDQELGKGALGTEVPIDPGPHKIEATAPGYNVWSTSVTIGANRDAQKLKIPSLMPAPHDAKGGPPAGANPALRPAGIAVGSVGVVGLVIGGVFGGLAMSAKGDLGKLCPGNGCPTGNGSQDKLASAKSKALISTIGVSVGGAALATGVVLVVLSLRGAPPRDEKAAPPKAALVPTFGPGGGGLSLAGAF